MTLIFDPMALITNSILPRTGAYLCVMYGEDCYWIVSCGA